MQRRTCTQDSSRLDTTMDDTRYNCAHSRLDLFWHLRIDSFKHVVDEFIMLMNLQSLGGLLQAR